MLERLFQIPLNRSGLTETDAMGTKGSYGVALGLKTWNAQLDLGGQLFGGLVVRRDSFGRSRLAVQASLLVGHLTARTADAPPLSTGRTPSSEFDGAFVSNPDKSRADIPSHEQFAGHGTVVNAELRWVLKMSWSDWVQTHSGYRRKIAPKIFAIASRST